jgi:hypothetical protein
MPEHDLVVFEPLELIFRPVTTCTSLDTETPTPLIEAPNAARLLLLNFIPDITCDTLVEVEHHSRSEMP